MWLMYWSWENKRHLQDVRDLRVRVYELEHDLYDTQYNVAILDNNIMAIAKLTTEEEK